MKLSARNIGLSREKNGAIFCLHVPFLSVQAGDIVAVVGQSGCGKSTLLDILALILRPDEGSMELRRADSSSVELTRASATTLARVRRRDLGYVLQSGGLLPFLNVRENILLPAKLLALPEGKTEKRLFELLEELDIVQQINKKPQHLSGGQRQRVAIARALIHNPSLVLADEPTAAVDSDTAERICDIFQRVVRNSNASAIIVSHDKELMQRYADATASFSLTTKADGAVHSTLVWPEMHSSKINEGGA